MSEYAYAWLCNGFIYGRVTSTIKFTESLNIRDDTSFRLFLSSRRAQTFTMILALGCF